jgi:hypothetical protein
MAEQAEWGTVVLGYNTLEGNGSQSKEGARDFARNHPGSEYKQRYNPGRNQELNLPPDLFPMKKGEKVNSAAAAHGDGVHEKIKKMIGDGIPRKEAIKRAHAQARAEQQGTVGTVTPRDVMNYKYQAERPGRQMSPFRVQEQNFPFI